MKLGFFFFKALNLLFHLVKFSCGLTVSFIKHVPCSKSFINMLCKSQHSSESRCSDCLRSDTKIETIRRTDWQHPINATHDMSDIINHSISAKTRHQKSYLGKFEAPLHIICKLLHIFYGEQRIIKEFFSQFFLGRLRERLEGYYSNSRIPRPFSLSTTNTSSGSSGFSSSHRWRRSGYFRS